MSDTEKTETTELCGDTGADTNGTVGTKCELPKGHTGNHKGCGYTWGTETPERKSGVRW